MTGIDPNWSDNLIKPVSVAADGRFDDSNQPAGTKRLPGLRPELASANTLHGQLALFTSHAAEIVTDEGISDESKLKRSAAHVLWMSETVMHYIGQDHAEAAAYFAMKAGIAYQQMLLAEAEESTTRLANQRANQRSGHVKVHGTPEQRSKRDLDMAEMFHDLYPKKLKKKMNAYRKVAEHFGVGLSTARAAISK